MSTCKNCNKEFTIYPEDKAFYNKMDVPEPTWCPQCRGIRRAPWRDERFLFYRTCSFSGKKILSEFPDSAPFPVYDCDIWNSDQWTPEQADYDPTRPFLEQWRELQLKSPRLSLYISRPTMVNSDYVNSAGYLKNCFMVFAAQESEDCYYDLFCYYSRNCCDCYVTVSNELAYDSVDCEKCYQVHYAENSSNCLNCYFISDCVGCRNCFGCTNLRNQEYFLWNKKVTPEEYQAELAKVNLGSWSAVAELKAKWLNFKNKNLICRYYHGRQNQDSLGDYLTGNKNVKYSFDVKDSENCRYCGRLTQAKDAYDYDSWALNSELIYETVSTGYDCYNLKFCANCWSGCRDLEYCDHCFSCRNCFGSVGLKKQEYCILNKKYSPKEYQRLVAEIKLGMRKAGVYGEFFPPAYSPHDFNHSAGPDLCQTTKEKAIAMGFAWGQEENKSVGQSNYLIPDDINEVKDEIVKELLSCESCSKNYKIIKQELDFYRQNKVPVPRQCFSCRHLARAALRNPRVFYKRQCMCEKSGHNHEGKCKTEFETTYAPDRSELIYCDECFQKEIY